MLGENVQEKEEDARSKTSTEIRDPEDALAKTDHVLRQDPEDALAKADHVLGQKVDSS